MSIRMPVLTPSHQPCTGNTSAMYHMSAHMYIHMFMHMSVHTPSVWARTSAAIRVL